MTIRDDLARTIAAALDSSQDDTDLAVAVGSTPTDVDYEVADILLDRFAITDKH